MWSSWTMSNIIKKEKMYCIKSVCFIGDRMVISKAAHMHARKAICRKQSYQHSWSIYNRFKNEKSIHFSWVSLKIDLLWENE